MFVTSFTKMISAESFTNPAILTQFEDTFVNRGRNSMESPTVHFHTQNSPSGTKFCLEYLNSVLYRHHYLHLPLSRNQTSA